MDNQPRVLGDVYRSMKNMRRLSIRALLQFTTLIAFVLALMAYDRKLHSKAEEVRIKEQQIIAQIDSSLGPAGIHVAGPGVSLTGEGSVVYLMPIGPSHPSLCSSDAYNRATIVWLEGDVRADTIRKLNDLHHLRTVGISIDSIPNGGLPPGFDELLVAATEFHQRRPDISFALTCDDWSGDVIFRFP